MCLCSLLQFIAFYFQDQGYKIILPLITCGISLFALVLYNYVNKSIAFLLTAVYLSVLFTVRPLILGPVWCVVLIYLILPILLSSSLEIKKKHTVWVFALFTLLAIFNLLGNIYTSVNNGEINLASELLFLIGSIIIIQKILLSFKNDTIELSEQASFTNYYLENLLSIAPIMMYTLDKDQRYKMASMEYLTGTGYDKIEDIIGKTKFDLFSDERYGKMDFSTNQDKNLLNGTKEKYSGTRELVMAGSKKLQWVAYKKVATKDKDGNITGILCVMNNVTEAIEKQKTLDLKNDELQHYIDSNLQLESFAFLASHDLKTPLRSISSFSQLLKQRASDKLNIEEKEYLDYIIDGSKNMNLLISDLLDYSTINKIEFKTSSINIIDLIEAVKRELSISIIENNVSLKLIDSEINKIEGDYVLLKQLLNNLISNAIKYKKDGIDPKIDIYCEQQSDAVLFKVKDNGIGIEEEYFNKIFLLFQRLHTAQTYDGTGIGLAICKQIVEKHGGKIWVESSMNKGSTFYFTIATKIDINKKLPLKIKQRQF